MNLKHLRMWWSLAISLICQSLIATKAEPLRGHNIQLTNIPFVASLATKVSSDILNRYHFCTGALIAKNLILTAAHCLEGKKYDQVDVVIGATDLRGAGPKYDVHSWITFDQWAAEMNLRLMNLKRKDVAIIKLKRQVRQSGVIPANITQLKNTELYGTKATLIGWIKGPENLGGRFLRKAHVQILKITDCAQRFELITNKIADIPEGLLCTAADPFVLTTKGDSGGPLLGENNNIVGINRSFCPSSSYNCTEEFADEHRFNLHTDLIPEYKHFINDVKRGFK